MSHMPITEAAWDEERQVYDYVPLMAAARPYIEGADFAVANLETTLAEKNYSGYPNFRSPDALAYGLKEVGFDLLLTANNHCMDARFSGLSRTLDVLDQVGLPHVGTSRTQAEADSDVYLADVGGISVAFLGYTYGTNGIPLSEDAPWSVNLFNTDYMTTLSTPDTDRLLAGLERAKALEPDLIAVMMHWGVEYQTRPNSYQEKLADLLIANGADLVLGGHPHVLQPMELRTVDSGDGTERTGFVCYSLGNFISSQVYDLTDTTAVLTLELTKDNETGESAVTGWTYVPMHMENPKLGGEEYVLVDAYQSPEDDPARQAIAVCHQILGSDHDPQAVPQAEP